MFTIVVDSRGSGEDVTTGFSGDMERKRLLEGTSSRLHARLAQLSDEDLEAYLVSCPVLWMPEHVQKQQTEYAHAGRFTRLRVDDRQVRYTFAPYPAFQPVPTTRLYELDPVFGFGPNGWHRTRMVAREEDMFELLGPDLVPPIVAQAPSEEPELFNITARAHDRLVCVMMPFNIPELMPVYEKLDQELTRTRIYCERADTDLGSRRIIDKIASLIFHADVVLCDFTGRNPNVFYEAGLAHGWSKKTIFLAEDGTDLPFDTRDQATIFYENDELGRRKLWHAIRDQLRVLAPDLLDS